MSKCVINIQLREFKNVNGCGFFVWQYDEDTKYYALNIYINKNLYSSNSDENRVLRKGARVHEFTHCVAAMILFSRLESKVLKSTLHKRMQEKFHQVNRDDLKQLLCKSTSQTKNNNENTNKEIFPDSHFRYNEGDGFDADYSDLEKAFLLSYALFCEYSSIENRKKIKALYNQDNKSDIIPIVSPIFEKLNKEKCLDKSFIIDRFSNYILPIILKN